MSKDELISLRKSVFDRVQTAFAFAKEFDHRDLEPCAAVSAAADYHAAVCREIAAAELPAGGDRDAILAQEALHVLDAFMQDHPEHCVQISVACEMIRGIGKGGDREILPR